MVITELPSPKLFLKMVSWYFKSPLWFYTHHLPKDNRLFQVPLEKYQYAIRGCCKRRSNKKVVRLFFHKDRDTASLNKHISATKFKCYHVASAVITKRTVPQSGVISVIKIHVTLAISHRNKHSILQLIWPCVQNTHPPLLILLWHEQKHQFRNRSWFILKRWKWLED